MRILFYATHPNKATGYARVANILTNALAKQGHEVHYCAISNFKDGTNVQRYVHPSIKIIDTIEESTKNGNPSEFYGVDVIRTILDDVKPDLFLIYNDLIVISRLLEEVKKMKERSFKVWLYLDLVYKFERIKLLRPATSFVDKVLVFSEYWKTHLVEDLKVLSEKCEIIPHGFDKVKFYPMNNLMCRKYFNIEEKKFVILNSNRNTYRKAWDITIRSFLSLYKRGYTDILLFVNTALDSQSGYTLLDSIEIECARLNLNFEFIVNNLIVHHPKSSNISDYDLNMLYNACDVGINTCVGEGFGLCNLEHAGIGKPQVVTNTGGLSDIFKGTSKTLVKPKLILAVPNHTDYHTGHLDICEAEDFTDKLEYHYNNRTQPEQETVKAHIKETYDWSKIIDSFLDLIQKYQESMKI
jgi:glycosyltransferase involved in cell wall biosynthesis